MKRREFITLLGGAVVSWPLVARAQQREDAADRRVDGPAPKLIRNHDFALPHSRGLAELGWTLGRNLLIEYRWAGRRPCSDANIRDGTGRDDARFNFGKYHPAWQPCSGVRNHSDRFRPGF